MKLMISTSLLVLWASSTAAWVVVTSQRLPVRLASTSHDADPVTRIHKSSKAEHHLEEMQQVWQELQQKEKQVEVSHDKVRAPCMRVCKSEFFCARESLTVLRRHLPVRLPSLIARCHGFDARNVGNGP